MTCSFSLLVHLHFMICLIIFCKSRAYVLQFLAIGSFLAFFFLNFQQLFQFFNKFGPFFLKKKKKHHNTLLHYEIWPKEPTSVFFLHKESTASREQSWFFESYFIIKEEHSGFLKKNGTNLLKNWKSCQKLKKIAELEENWKSCRTQMQKILKRVINCKYAKSEGLHDN